MIAIGRLTRPHGLQGEVVFLPYVHDVELLPNLHNRRVCLRRATDLMTQERMVVAYRRSHKRLLMQLEGCHDVTQAEALRDYEVCIARQHFPPLPEGEYYWFDIEGLRVFTDDGHMLGTIAEIIYTGSNDVYVVQDGSQEFLIPALRDVVRCINLERGEVHLFAVPDLLE